MTTLAETASTTIAAHDLLPAGVPVLAMVSGGGDSVALLHLLASGALGEHPLRVLHVNHLLRGVAADEDASFVETLCSELGVECRVVRYDVSDFAERHGLNLEDAGRRVRYRFAEEELDSLCEERRARCDSGRIAVAHTLDDRIETFFMRAIAGSGTGALASIAAHRGRIARPLIDCDRSAVREYLRQTGVEWREDESNSDTARSRAFVRAELMPAAERLNPAFRASLARTMNLLGDDDALLSRLAEGFVRDFTEARPGEVRFNREWMSSLEHTMARRTVRDALVAAFPEASRLEASHIEALAAGFGDGTFARDLPYGLRAFTEYATLVVAYADTVEPGLEPGLLTLPGRVDLGGAGEIEAGSVEPGDTDGTADSVVIDVDRTKGELTVDSVREGDRMRPFGMEGSRKLSDLLIDAKVPRRERRMHPVVRDGETIVWLAGVRVSEEYRVTPNTRKAVRLTWTRAGDDADLTSVTGANG